MKVRKKRSRTGIVILLVFAVIGVSCYSIGKPYYNLHFKKINSIDQNITLYIPTGIDINAIAVKVSEQDILDKEIFLDFSDQLGFTTEKVEPGKYLIKQGMKIKSFIYALKNGNQELKDVRITFNNCKSLEDIAGKVSKNIEADSIQIIEYLLNGDIIEKYGFKPETFIAMFLPDTYEVGEWDMTAEKFTQYMAEKFTVFWTEPRLNKAANLNLSQSEISTIASIIEAEQGINTREWKTIAGLYLNRVSSGMKLQSDPTFKFCWGDELNNVQRLTNEHRRRDCPYNTYIYAGLPPGPIRNPSKKAIDAVLNAEEHNYIFMCAKPDNSGLHNFAETNGQHSENARKFWRYMDQKNQ